MSLGSWLSRRGNVEMSLDAGVRRVLEEFLREFAARMKWDEDATRRLCAAGEETLMNLVERGEGAAGGARRLRVAARNDGKDAVIDFLAAPQGANLEEEMGMIREGGVPADSREMSLRLLSHYAASVRHRQYRANDLVTVRVEERRAP